MTRLSAFVCCGLLLVSMSASAQQSPVQPRTISYQGTVASSDGASVDGVRDFTIRLYSDPEGRAIVWQDTYHTQVVNGVFSVTLGSGAQPLPSSDMLSHGLWVGTQIGNAEEMRPLAPLSASPFALSIADNSVTKEKMATDYVSSVTLNGQKVSGRGADINLETGDGIVATVDPATNTLLMKSGPTSLEGAKGGAVQGNTTISGSLTVTGASYLGSSSSPTTIYGNLALGAGKTLTIPGLAASSVVRTNASSVLTTGLVSISDLSATGTASSSTFLRGDGTWASTLSDITESYTTASPYSSGNAGEQLLASGADANISIALQPKGNGALEAQLADGTVTGGNIRGQYAVDWQMARSANTQVASGNYATVGGGYGNTASVLYATIGGGDGNAASGQYATAGGGYTNTASGYIATVGGGFGNTASNTSATVGGGYGNTASGGLATVGGGQSNTASNYFVTVGGGYGNTASGNYSTIPGGEHLTLSGHDDFGFLSGNNNTGASMSISANQTSVFGNTDLWLANNDNTARALYFYAPSTNAPAFPNGDNYVGFKAGAVTTSVIWTLPLADGTSGQVLSTNGSGTLSWAEGDFTQSVNTSAPNATVPVVQLIATNAATTVDVALTPKGFGALTAQVADNGTTGGNKRGQEAVDWQMIRGANTQVASGSYSTVSGGNSNIASNTEATVGGGGGNTASGNTSTISGGGNNTASGLAASTSGGLNNTASGDYSSISGGYYANASHYGQNTQASGRFGTAGDAQSSVFTERKSTTDATTTELMLDGGSQHLTVPASGSWTYHALITARKDDGTTDGWELRGIASNVSGTLTLTQGTTTQFGATAWTVAAAVSGTTLQFNVTGAAATNIRWVARVETAEVIY